MMVNIIKDYDFYLINRLIHDYIVCKDNENKNKIKEEILKFNIFEYQLNILKTKRDNLNAIEYKSYEDYKFAKTIYEKRLKDGKVDDCFRKNNYLNYLKVNWDYHETKEKYIFANLSDGIYTTSWCNYVVYKGTYIGSLQYPSQHNDKYRVSYNYIPTHKIKKQNDIYEIKDLESIDKCYNFLVENYKKQM